MIRRRRSSILVFPLRRTVMLACLSMLLGAPSTVRAQSEAVEYYGTDALGSVRVVFDASGNILRRMDYGPFGQELSPSTGKQSNVYAGLFVDEEAGLDHSGTRGFQSRTGRFSSVDPVYAGLFEPQRWNRYAYALNNPVSLRDSTGLNAESGLQCTWEEVATESGLDTKLKCTQQGGGGGGGSSGPSAGFLEMMNWLAGKALDTFLGAEPVGGDEADLIPIVHSGFKPSSGVDAAVGAVLVVAAVATGKVAGAAVESAAARSTSEELLAAAASAVAEVGPGKGAAYGTEVHSAFRASVEGLNLPGVKTEVSYLNGQVVSWGTPGSVRLDAVLYDAEGGIAQIYDLKTGSAVLSPQRVNKIMSQLPAGSRPPITVIKP